MAVQDRAAGTAMTRYEESTGDEENVRQKPSAEKER